MKRILSLLLVAVMVLSMVPAVSFAAEPVTVYLDPQNGSNENDGTEAAPVQNFTKAYELLKAGGGTIVMLSTVYYAGSYTFPACGYPVTITGKTGAEGIRTVGNLVISGDTTFQNLTLTLEKASTSTMISGSGHKLTLGENMTIVPFVNTTDSYYFCVQGGNPGATVESTDVTILSGRYRNIYVGGYTRPVTGTARLTMTGGTAATVAAGYSGTTQGNVEMSFSGTANVTNAIYAGAWTTGNVGGNSTITLGQGVQFTNLFCGSNGTGGIAGTSTVIYDGFAGTFTALKGKGNTSCTGTLGGSRLVLKSGTVSRMPSDFTAVEVAIPEGKTLTVATDVSSDTLSAAGELRFSGLGRLNTAAVTGSVAPAIEGPALKNHVYITAPTGSDITFPAGTNITDREGKWVNHDMDAFCGLIVASDSANKVNLYGDIWAQGTDKVYSVVEPYHTETLDGITYRYYPNARGGYHVRASRSGYITLYKNIYMRDAEATSRTLETVTLDKKGTEGFVPSTMYSHTTEVLESAWKSEASMYPKYEAALVNPVFDEGRDPHQMTTNEELEASIASVDKPDDDMYVFSLGESSRYGLNIPVVIFTQSDLSQAKTVEQAAQLMGGDKLTVYYRAQMHGNEPGGTEGALAMIHHLQQGYADEILDKLDLIIVPRLSPDGSQLYQRLLPSSINPNRDQLLLGSSEMQAFQKGYLLFDPEIVLDGHERVWNNNAGDIQVSACFTPMNSDAFHSTALQLDDAAFRELEANGLAGFYYATCVNELDPNMGGGYYPAAGSIYVLMESRGIHGGNEAMERRAVAHMAAVSGMLDYLHENDTQVKSVIAAERAAVATRGETYEETDLFVLQTGSRTATAADVEAWTYLKINRQTVDWETGEVTFPVRYPAVKDVVKRTRVAPTAYVIPAGESWADAVLALMDAHGISYTFLPAGATLPLQRYGGTTSEATLGMETDTRFASGCYVFTMNQAKGLLLATFMEPDNTNALEFQGGLVQSGMIPQNSAVYRYIRDLNAQGTVDYTVTEAQIETVTVYLDGTNGLDTNNGLTEAAPVKTIAKAYAIMEAALSGADAGSYGNLVVMGMYDLGAQQTILPDATYPVVITGKTAADGLSFTGGSSQDYRTLELGGDTTFRNLTLHINNTQSFNFLLAKGHKLVLDTGINCTTKKANCYFTVAGGSYGYKDVDASSDITVRSGKWRTIYAGGYRGSVTGLAKADISDCWVYQNIIATYCGNVGSVELRVADTTVSTAVATSAIYAGPADYNATNDVGAVKGNATLVLGENISAKAVYASSRDKGNILGTVTVIADGVDLSQVPVYAKSATKGTTAAAVLKLNRDVTQNVTLDPALPLDLNGHDITGSLTVSGTLTVFDSQTDDFTVADEVYGKITGAVTGTLAAAPGYVALKDNSFHRFEQTISGVSIRPSEAGVYYTGKWSCDEVLAANIASFGVAVSLKDMPGADFRSDLDTLWTSFGGSQLENGVQKTSAIISGILKEGKDNDTRGKTDIYAVSYVILTDGTVLTGTDNIAYSLYDVMRLAEDTAFETNKEALNAFYNTWKDVMASWDFQKIGK